MLITNNTEGVQKIAGLKPEVADGQEEVHPACNRPPKEAENYLVHFNVSVDCQYRLSF